MTDDYPHFESEYEQEVEEVSFQNVHAFLSEGKIPN